MRPNKTTSEFIAPDGEKVLIQRESVRSSNLRTVGYNDVYDILEIEFHAGGSDVRRRIYRYQGVPRHVYESLMAAPSKGKYHDRHIKWAYPYTQIQ